DADATSAPFALSRAVIPPTRLDVIRQYLILGFTHVVPHGVHHILFVLGLFLLSARVKPVLLQVTSFTVAHSITLGLTIYGVVSVSPRIVEPAIALSIAYVAIENLTTSKLKPWRVAIVFAFGLLHGMGFAGVLKDLGLPRNQFLTALITFNVGVEAGQLAVIASSHREAPLISEDPAADATDLYVFRSPDAPNTVTFVANYYPFANAQGGPNFARFSDNVLYEIHIDNNGDAKEDITYQFRFRTDTRNG